MKIGTTKKPIAPEPSDIQLSDVSIHFADDATPEDAGGPGALIAEAHGAVLRFPASDPDVAALVTKLTDALKA